MNEKTQKMIQVGMKLFTKKGFHNTSIQEIADACGVSKGAFYLHFKSKKEFVIAIYEYYYSTMKTNLDNIEQQADLDAREKLAKEITVFYEEFLKQKEFIIMHFHENFQVHEELESLILKMRSELFDWLERRLLDVYGDAIQPFIVDGATLVTGLLDSYLKIMFFTGVDVNLEEIGRFLVRRIDDMAFGMIKTEKSPLFTKSMLKPYFQSVFSRNVKEKVANELIIMKEKVDSLSIESMQKQDLYETLEVLLNEIKKEEPQKIIFQGMLSNLQSIKELEENRNEVATILQLN
ncbi:TetR/AcrR family transcriptional regulator [Bacillus sp. Marseille-P3661]|uniref:TetR/AcrR family transcriptional regulator n=1 Tax=Bacillus sp. Marseille-P3661 TaxID=1936234 RepID=UPI000C855B5B|nr:TetR/AcrR family transcriptional regulator [Bacillus sp. Marseille-P3661]